jgi:hypothetical protein
MESFAITLLVAVLFTGVVVMMIFVQFLAVGRESHERFGEIMQEIRNLSARVNALSPAPASKPEEKSGS